MSKARKLVALGLGALLWAGAASAQPYQFEVQGDYLRLSSGGDHLNTYGVAGGWFFQPVKGAHGPYAEDAFLERAGSLWVAGALLDGENDVDGKALGASLDYMAPGSPFKATVSYTHSWFDAGDEDADLDDVEVRLGYFVQRSLLVGVRYEYSRFEFEDDDASTNEYGVFAKWVGLLAHDQAVNVEAAASVIDYDNDDSNVVLSLGGDFYFTRAFSLGASVASNSGDNDFAEGTTLEARAQYFITPTFAVRASIGKFYASEDEVDDETTFNVGLTARF